MKHEHGSMETLYLYMEYKEHVWLVVNFNVNAFGKFGQEWQI